MRQRQIGQIEGDEIDEVRYDGTAQRPDVVTFEVPDTSVGSEPAPQLPDADVHRIDTSRTSVEQRGREAAGAGADVDGNPVGDRNGQCVQRVRQLHVAAQTRSGHDANRGVGPDTGERVGERSTVHEHSAGGNRRRVDVRTAAREQCDQRDEPRPSGLGHWRTSGARTERGPSRPGGPRARCHGSTSSYYPGPRSR